ncbi:hypothetical protein Scep_014202 [Stephania cephalantha]|uniref:Beta-galactosidase beta-sandwich domain-containing protein n=1 Tax=Stephania cephalantha TaxID=152367 RepID=A0AAP0J3C6_9MAGN
MAYSINLDEGPKFNDDGHNFVEKNIKFGDDCFSLSNANQTTDTTISFQDNQFTVPAGSVSILPDCKTETYNTAKTSIEEDQSQLANQRLQQELLPLSKQLWMRELAMVKFQTSRLVSKRA